MLELPFVTFRRLRGSYTETDPFAPSYVYVQGPGFSRHGTEFGNVCRLRDKQGSKRYEWNSSAVTLADGREVPAVVGAIAEDFDALEQLIMAHVLGAALAQPGNAPAMATGEQPTPMAPTLVKNATP